MRRNTSLALGFFALALWLVPAGTVLAGDENTSATGDLLADDANQGTGLQVNADDWEDMDAALAGSGNQSSSVDGSANTGSGSQNNSDVLAFDWEEIVNGNAGSGSQVIDTENSNGGDRDSDDVVVQLGDGSTVASAALEASVTGNAVDVDGMGGSSSSDIAMDASSGFSNMYGVSAVAASSGANASQNVSVNVTADVGIGGGGY